MTIFISVIILLLSMLITASLQLVPGTFSIFYHYALGKTTAKKADDRSLSFILGVEIFTSLIWILLLIILSVICLIVNLYSAPIFLIVSGILFAEAIAFLLFYYRHGHSVSLFVPRNTATALKSCACKTSSRSDAIALGFFTSIPELIFTIPLYFISTIIFLNIPALLPIIIPYTILITVPLFIMRIFYHNGHNLAHITRFRTKAKPYLRIAIPLLYIALALAVLTLGIYYG